jgi:DNA-binding IclR family transcriptional regulator
MATTKSKKSKRSKDSGSAGIRVIARAADILNALSKHPDGLTLGEIALRVELPRSTVQRIVQALDEANMVIAASPTSGVRLGPALLVLAASVKQLGIAELARPLVVQLSKDTGETVDLAVLGTDKAVVVDQIHGTHPLLAVSALGGSIPLHCSASGKVLLATLPPARLALLRSRLTLPAMTEHSITSWAALDREIESVRRSGVAFDREEYRMGICAVAIALRGPGDEVIAVSMPVPTDRFIATEKRLIDALVDRSQAFQRRI